MPEKPFVVNDRRKFTSEGELRPGVELDAPPAVPGTLPPDAEPGRSGNEPQAESQPEAGKLHKEPIAFPASSPKAPESNHSADVSDAEPAGERNQSHPGARPHETIAFPGPAASGSDSTAHPAEEDAEREDALPPLTKEQLDQATRAYAATVDRLDTALRANNLGSEPIPAMNFERLVQSLYMQALIQLGGAAEPGQPPQVDILGARQTIDMLTLVEAKSKGNLSRAEDDFLQSALFEIRMGFLEVAQALARQAAPRQPGGGIPGGPKGPGIVR